MPALTMREIRLGFRDADNGRHWVGTCWCKTEHDGRETGLTFVAPPWDGERAQ
jgi:hypothetical protein